ncbi:MAG: molybdopterin oxidoreductase family protein [Alphaproteobacteria bacterium]|nr:molybdopterin oxidoreductase family protein [Alphaproteobacteria bacterium]
MPLDHPSTNRSALVPSVCPHDCPSVCALEIERIDENTIGRVRGGSWNDYTAGVVCAKMGRYAERVHSPDRMMHPLIRTGKKGAGEFRRATWEEALDLIGEKFNAAEAEFGPESVWPYNYAGTMGLVMRDGIRRLTHAKRYSRQDDTFCTRLAETGWLAGVGEKRGVDGREIAKSDLIVVWGGNPVSTQVNLMTHITQARKDRDAKLVVIDPYRTPTAAVADIHLMPRPGTDGALACAVMHILFRDGHADRDYLAKYTDADGRLEAHLTTRDAAWAEAITGIPAAEIEAFATLYGKTRRSYIRVGYGFSRSRNGSAQLHAVSCLPAITGAWQYEGGGALWGQGRTYNLDKTMIEGLDVKDSGIRELDMSQIGRVLTGDAEALKHGGPVKAMVIQNCNPACVAPETAKVIEGFEREDLFLAVNEQFMTDTARYADVVLPATSFLEHPDIYTASAHTILQVAKPVIGVPGECRTNHYVIQEIAKRVGAEHPGFHLTDWELIDDLVLRSGLPDAETIWANRGQDTVYDFDRQHFLTGFPTDDGKFHFRADWEKVGHDASLMPELPDHQDVIEQADAEHPFRLVAAPARNYLNSTWTETRTSKVKEGRPEIMIHPHALERLGLADGDKVRVGNHRGEIVVHAKAFDGLREGTVVIESVWPNTAFEGGLGVNTLTSADPGLPKRGAVFHDTKVWVRAA